MARCAHLGFEWFLIPTGTLHRLSYSVSFWAVPLHTCVWGVGFHFYGQTLTQSSGGAPFAAASSATPSRWSFARILDAQVLLFGRGQRRERRCIENMFGLLERDGTHGINKTIRAQVPLSSTFPSLNGQACHCAPRARLPTIFMGHQRGGGAAQAIPN